MKNIMVIGATSGIAQEVSRCFASDGAKLFLVGRDGAKLEVLKQDLKVRGASDVSIAVLDMNQFEFHGSLWDKALGALGEVDGILVAHGSLGDQKACESDWALASREFNTNFLSVASFLTTVSGYFEKKGSGVIAVIGSVAGDRGRQSNYIYGSAKGGLEVFLAGLRNRLSRKGVCVLTIKPGFVDTPMTAHVKKGPLFASAASVGRTIFSAMKNKRDIIYVPWFWQFIMLIIRNIPEKIFKRLSL